MADIKYFLKVARSEVKISEKEYRSGNYEHAKRRLLKLLYIIEQISDNDLKEIKQLEEIKKRINNLLNQINQDH